MPKKLSSNSKSAVEPEPLSEESSIALTPSSLNRPKSSPYTSPIAKLLIGPSKAFYVAKDLLQNPDWITQDLTWDNSIRLSDVDEKTGHVLVHYLYTGAYQALDNTGFSPLDEAKSEFRSAFLAYTAAKSYKLQGLQQLAQHKIEEFGAELNIFDITEAIETDFSKLSNDIGWFHHYLDKKVGAAFEKDCTVFAGDFLDGIGDISLTRVLAKCVVRCYQNKVSRLLSTKADDVPGIPKEHMPNTQGPTVDEPPPQEALTKEFTTTEKGVDVDALDSAPAQATEENKVDEYDWGFGLTPKKKKKSKKSAATLAELPLPDSAQEDDPWDWSSWGTKKKTMDKSATTIEVVPPPELLPATEPAKGTENEDLVAEEKPAESAPDTLIEDDVWGYTPKKSKKDKNKDKEAVIARIEGQEMNGLLAQPSAPEPAGPVEDDWGWFSKKASKLDTKKKKKKAKMYADVDEVKANAEAYPQPCSEAVDALEPICHPEAQAASEEAVCDIEVNTERPVDLDSEICPSRIMHLLEGDDWKNCNRCRALVRQLAVQLPRGNHTGEDGYEVVDSIVSE